MVVDRHAIADACIDDADAAVNLAARANRRLALDRHARPDDRVCPDRHVAVDVGGRGILDRDAGCHQLGGFSLAQDAADGSEIAPAVDAANVIRIWNDHGFHPLPAFPKNGDEIRQVVLALRVVGRQHPQRREQPVDRERIDSRVDLADLSLR